jgi:hypothetical protein
MRFFIHAVNTEVLKALGTIKALTEIGVPLGYENNQGYFILHCLDYPLLQH